MSMTIRKMALEDIDQVLAIDGVLMLFQPRERQRKQGVQAGITGGLGQRIVDHRSLSERKRMPLMRAVRFSANIEGASARPARSA